jgi:hypothetical protein
LQHAVAECDRLGLQFDIMQCAGWGQAGGTEVPPAETMKRVVRTESQITGGKKISLASIPMPMPDAPQWVQLEFEKDHSFSSLRTILARMRE